MVLCDECKELFRGSGKGDFVPVRDAVEAIERKVLWERGKLDCRWYCLECWADYAQMPVEAMPTYLGWEERCAKRQKFKMDNRRSPKNIGWEDELSLIHI